MKDVFSSFPSLSVLSKPTLQQLGFCTSLLTHAIKLDEDQWRYRTWTLSDISVTKWEFEVGHGHSLPCEGDGAGGAECEEFCGKGEYELIKWFEWWV